MAQVRVTTTMGREERCQRLTAAFEWPMLVASLLVVPTIAIENAGLSAAWTSAATILNWLIWIAFLTEFVVLLAVAPDRGSWLFKHPLELAIVVLTTPFGPPGLQSARAFRLLRLLRLVRVAKLARSLFSLDDVKWRR
jgi:voltage-gated potassium channel